ncbi:MAG: hypothetical protein BWK76_04800 [Desulfobulbaceae bacterium A2]|nr:MAG: hypothetical protein BWK76_04800 [Desulfobulbaceae bacterium A2]
MRTLIITILVFGATALSVQAQPGDADGTDREKMRQRMQERMRQLDANGDGSISKTEFMALAEQRFAKLDTNGDGQISKEERAAIAEKVRQRQGAGLLP